MSEETKSTYKELYATFADPQFEHRSDASIDTIVDYLSQGVPVIAEFVVDRFYPSQNAWTHIAVITGIEDDALICHDPHATYGKADVRFAVKDFLASWEELQPGCGRLLYVITLTTPKA